MFSADILRLMASQDTHWQHPSGIGYLLRDIGAKIAQHFAPRSLLPILSILVAILLPPGKLLENLIGGKALFNCCVSSYSQRISPLGLSFKQDYNQYFSIFSAKVENLRKGTPCKANPLPGLSFL